MWKMVKKFNWKLFENMNRIKKKNIEKPENNQLNTIFGFMSHGDCLFGIS